VFSSKEWCKYKYMYGLIRTYADSDTAYSFKEQWKCKYGEMQEHQKYAQTQVSEIRRQRVSQAKKRYNCYTEKNIVLR